MSHLYSFGSPNQVNILSSEEQPHFAKYCLPNTAEEQQQQQLFQQDQFNSAFPFEGIEEDEFLSFVHLPICEDEADKIDEMMVSMTVKMNSNNEQEGSSASLKTETSLPNTVEYANYPASVQVPTEYPIQQQYQSYQVSQPQQLFYSNQWQAQSYPSIGHKLQDSAKHIDYYSIYEQQCNEKLKKQSQNIAPWNQNQQNNIQEENNNNQYFNNSSNFNTYPSIPADIYGSCPPLETSHSNTYSSASSHCGDSDHHTLPLFSFPEPVKNIKNDHFDFFSYFQTSNIQDSQQKSEITESIADKQDSQISRNFSQSTAHSVASPSSSSRSVSQSYFLQVIEKEQPQLESQTKQESFENSSFFLPQNPDFYSAQRKAEITVAMKKSNKKNVVRNLMRAFKQYFLQKRSSEQIMRTYFQGQSTRDVQQKFKRYFAQRKFNHNSIKQLVQHEKYGNIFHQFLKEHSQAYLKNSSVKLQELHQVFIDFLLLCFQDEELLDSLETYSKIKNPFV